MQEVNTAISVEQRLLMDMAVFFCEKYCQFVEVFLDRGFDAQLWENTEIGNIKHDILWLESKNWREKWSVFGLF